MSSITVLGDGLRRWRRWAVFFTEIYTYICSYDIFISIPPFPMPLGRQEWVDGVRQLQMTMLAFLFGKDLTAQTETFKKNRIYSSNIKDFQGRG